MFLGLQLMVLAGSLTAGSNYFLRRSILAGGSSRAFLLIQLACTFLVAILLNPVRSGNFFFSTEVAYLGLFGGTILGIMMTCLGKALENGPAGLTVAFLNASTVFPILGMVALFGKEYGFEYTLWNGAGSLIVVAALFWAGFETMKGGSMSKWLFFAFSTFALHTLFLMLLQWRSLLMNFPGQSLFFSTSTPEKMGSEWFMPMAFLAATLVQLVVYLKQENRPPLPQEVRFGLLGGAANGLGTFFMIRSTEIASPLEQAMIFPLFAVTIVLICNVWGQFLFKEKIHWKATFASVAGIAVGTVNWSAFF